jgi:DNA-binding transcriptional ArsR family regulator|nr:metalloregulator ArsR/SmtB family transcription factor [uncultured Serinicoccus sp.]
MTMTAKVPIGHEGPERDAGLPVAAALFHGLSDPSRLAILQHLRLGEHRVRDLTEHLGLAQSTVSAHLACLRDCGLVVSRPQGRASMFSLTSAPELLGVLDAAERLLASTGSAVALCPNYGIGTEGNPAPQQLRTHAGQGEGA